MGVKREVVEPPVQLEEKVRISHLAQSVLESPMQVLAITRGSSLGLSSVESTRNRYFLIVNYRCLSHLLIWCSSSDNCSTLCFPTGISLHHAKSDLHHFYNNVSKQIFPPSLWICTILYERRISLSKINFSATQYVFACLSVCRFVFEVGNVPTLSHHDLGFQGICGEWIPGGGWILTAARTRSTPHQSCWWTTFLVPQPPCSACFSLHPCLPHVQITTFSPHGDFSTLATAGRWGQGAPSYIWVAATLQEEELTQPAAPLGLPSGPRSFRYIKVFCQIRLSNSWTANPGHAVRRCTTCCQHWSWMFVWDISGGGNLWRQPFASSAGYEYRTFWPSAFTKCEWTGSMWR